ncbi:sigma-54 dependent transcriptional regulator [Tabrizicola sp. YIM 78059]|uniref:sigma-54-dependent transcriptional regulator n=1 Tax=Tabrizicola sp. YIM 78059 TaxID=2529861 RepID=UPI0010AA8500|nr:sigma-54 dependent transcriptional regulator [Tabrizicola sp. YIM 78059]
MKTPTTSRPPLLLIEDTSSLQMVYRSILSGAGFRVSVAGSAAEGLAQFQALRPAVVLLDLVLPDRDGLQLMQEFLAMQPETAIIAITANGSVNRAVEAMRAGAHDFLVKPFDENRLLGAVQNLLKERGERRAEESGIVPSVESATLPDTSGFIGSSEAMKRIHATIASVARSMATVFITGESGTGKELCALAVHANSARASGPFIALNCGAIPQDLLESEVFGHMKGSFTGAISDKPGAAAAADGGTLFLDEICEMAPALQTKLLRFLQTSTVQPVGATRPRKVNVRIVCATNRDPLDAVRRGQFREDLYYRLFVVPIHMPPLRERGHDVIEIAEAALQRFAEEEGRRFHGLTPETRALLLQLPWPGNVRQLLNVIRNVVVLNRGGWVTPEMLPPGLADDLPARATSGPQPDPDLPTTDSLVGLTLAEAERLLIEATLARHGNSIPRAARVLDVSPSTLYRKIEGWKARAS